MSYARARDNWTLSTSRWARTRLHEVLRRWDHQGAPGAHAARMALRSGERYIWQRSADRELLLQRLTDYRDQRCSRSPVLARAVTCALAYLRAMERARPQTTEVAITAGLDERTVWIEGPGGQRIPVTIQAWGNAVGILVPRPDWMCEAETGPDELRLRWGAREES